MKLRFEFEVEIDGGGFARYYAAYPEIAEDDGKDPLQTLIREAATVWDLEGLIADFVSARSVTAGLVVPWKKIE